MRQKDGVKGEGPNQERVNEIERQIMDILRKYIDQYKLAIADSLTRIGDAKYGKTSNPKGSYYDKELSRILGSERMQELQALADEVLNTIEKTSNQTKAQQIKSQEAIVNALAPIADKVDEIRIQELREIGKRNLADRAESTTLRNIHSTEKSILENATDRSDAADTVSEIDTKVGSDETETISDEISGTVGISPKNNVVQLDQSFMDILLQIRDTLIGILFSKGRGIGKGTGGGGGRGGKGKKQEDAGELPQNLPSTYYRDFQTGLFRQR